MSFCRGQTQILPRQTFFLETRDMCTAHRNKENQIFKQSNMEILILLKYIALLTNGLDIPTPPPPIVKPLTRGLRKKGNFWDQYHKVN